MKAPQALLLALLSLFCCFFPSQALAAAAKQQQRQHLRARASRASGADDGEESGNEESKQASDDDEEDDDDDDEEATKAHVAFKKGLSDGDEKAKVYTVVGEGKAPAEEEAEPAPAPAPLPAGLKGPHAKEEAALKKAIEEIEEELAANLQEQASLRKKIEHLEDGSASDKEIDANAKLVANETDSAAMATMLARMWKEMRMFEVPFFAQHVEEELKILKKEEKELNTKLEDAEAKLAAARKKWAAEKAAAAAEAAGEEEEEPAKKEKKKEKEAAGAGTSLHDAEEGSLANAVHKMGDDKWIKDFEKETKQADFWSADTPGKIKIFINSIITVLFIVLFAYLYFLASKSAKYKSYLTPQDNTGVFPASNAFSHNLFSCFSDLRMTFLGCCCLGCRWADTLDKSNLLPYWKGIAIVIVCEALSAYTFGMSGFVFILAAVYYRQKLRDVFQIESRSPKTLVFDCLTWSCCSCCAAIQEAREAHIRRAGG